jgi:hypothetical protein
MLWDLQRMDLGGWKPRQIYETIALQEQKAQSLRGLDAWVEEMLQAGMLPVPMSAGYPNRCLSDNLLAVAKQHAKFTNGNVVPKKLKKIFGEGGMNPKGGSARAWEFPPLADCRRKFEAYMGGHWDWHHEIAEWQGPEARRKAILATQF